MPYKFRVGLLVMFARGAAVPGHSPRPPGRARAWTYPVAPRGATVDDYNGVKVADPYRALEDLDAGATRAWVSAEAHLTAVLSRCHPAA